MRRDSMLGKDVDEEELGEVSSSDCVMSRNENALLGEAINDNENGGVAIGVGELLNEVHGD